MRILTKAAQKGSFFYNSGGSLRLKAAVEAIGITGAIRVSPLHCHGAEDIDRFLEITSHLA